MGLGGAVCGFFTAGACIVPFGGVALGLVGNATSHYGAQRGLEGTLPGLEEDLALAERNVVGRFEAMGGRP
jgi:hypothetical protein